MAHEIDPIQMIAIFEEVKLKTEIVLAESYSKDCVKALYWTPGNPTYNFKLQTMHGSEDPVVRWFKNLAAAIECYNHQ